MAAMNELKAVHMPSEAHREFRALVKYRKTLDYRINKIKCIIRAWFVNHGIGIATGEAAWHSGRERINSFRKPLVQCTSSELWKDGLDIEITQLDSLSAQLTKRGNPLARTILVECAWASLRYNPWAKEIYDRICGKQKTRKKKAAIALARKIAVLAWAMLKDEKDWDPKRMIEVTESYGRMNLELKEKLSAMTPKENSDQRKSRHRKEARAAKEATNGSTPAATTTSTPAQRKAPKKKTSPTIAKDSRTRTKSVLEKSGAVKSASTKLAAQRSPSAKPSTKPRRARKPVSRADARLLTNT